MLMLLQSYAIVFLILELQSAGKYTVLNIVCKTSKLCLLPGYFNIMQKIFAYQKVTFNLLFGNIRKLVLALKNE